MTAHDYLKRDDVIKGVEIKITPKKMREVNMAGYLPMHTLHINVYELNDYQFQDLENISFITADLDEFIDYIKSNNLNYQYNHPFWHERRETMNWKAIPAIAKNYFDVIELNAGRPKVLNDLALYLAQEYDKGITSSTDSHTGRPGRARVLAKGQDFNEMWDNIKQGDSYIVRNDITALGVMEEAAYMIENIFDEKLLHGVPKNKIYAPDTGISILDNIAKRVHKTGYDDMIGKLAYKGLSSFNKSYGEVLAGRLYVNRENKFGEKIASTIMGMVYDSKIKISEPVADYA
jgi:hypothetical protein